MKLYLSPVHLFLANKRKKDHNPGPYLGYAYSVPRVRLPELRGRIYRPAKGDEALPVLFNIHGGSWIFGDAEGVDLQSQYLANHLECMVVNIDYRLLDEYPFPYQQTEVADTVEYFLARADEYHILRDHAAVAGYSAGGHICAGAAMLLRDRGVKFCTQVLCYPFLNYVNFSLASYVNLTGTKAKMLNSLADKVLFEKMPKESVLLSPANADPADLKGLEDAVIITSGLGDALLPQGETYAEKLRAAGVNAVYKEYEKAVHGFMERGFPDDPAVFANEDPQDTLMRQGVDFIKAQDIFKLKG